MVRFEIDAELGGKEQVRGLLPTYIGAGGPSSAQLNCSSRMLKDNEHFCSFEAPICGNEADLGGDFVAYGERPNLSVTWGAGWMYFSADPEKTLEEHLSFGKGISNIDLTTGLQLGASEQDLTKPYGPSAITLRGTQSRVIPPVSGCKTFFNVKDDLGSANTESVDHAFSISANPVSLLAEGYSCCVRGDICSEFEEGLNEWIFVDPSLEIDGVLVNQNKKACSGIHSNEAMRTFNAMEAPRGIVLDPQDTILGATSITDFTAWTDAGDGMGLGHNDQRGFMEDCCGNSEPNIHSEMECVTTTAAPPEATYFRFAYRTLVMDGAKRGWEWLPDYESRVREGTGAKEPQRINPETGSPRKTIHQVHVQRFNELRGTATVNYEVSMPGTNTPYHTFADDDDLIAVGENPLGQQTVKTGTLTFNDGDEVMVIELVIDPDQLPESDEVFEVILSSPTTDFFGSTPVITWDAVGAPTWLGHYVTINNDDSVYMGWDPDRFGNPATLTVGTNGTNGTDINEIGDGIIRTLRDGTLASGMVTDITFTTIDGSAECGVHFSADGSTANPVCPIGASFAFTSSMTRGNNQVGGTPVVFMAIPGSGEGATRTFQIKIELPAGANNTQATSAGLMNNILTVTMVDNRGARALICSGAEGDGENPANSQLVYSMEASIVRSTQSAGQTGGSVQGGIMIAEASHSIPAFIDWITQNIAALNINVLFLEHISDMPLLGPDGKPTGKYTLPTSIKDDLIPEGATVKTHQDILNEWLATKGGPGTKEYHAMLHTMGTWDIGSHAHGGQFSDNPTDKDERGFCCSEAWPGDRMVDQWMELFKACSDEGIDIVGINLEDDAINKRNIHWAKKINGYLSTHPTAKFLIVGGAAHATGVDLLGDALGDAFMPNANKPAVNTMIQVNGNGGKLFVPSYNFQNPSCNSGQDSVNAVIDGPLGDIGDPIPTGLGSWASDPCFCFWKFRGDHGVDSFPPTYQLLPVDTNYIVYMNDCVDQLGEDAGGGDMRHIDFNCADISQPARDSHYEADLENPDAAFSPNKGDLNKNDIPIWDRDFYPNKEDQNHLTQKIKRKGYGKKDWAMGQETSCNGVAPDDGSYVQPINVTGEDKCYRVQDYTYINQIEPYHAAGGRAWSDDRDSRPTAPSMKSPAQAVADEAPGQGSGRRLDEWEYRSNQGWVECDCATHCYYLEYNGTPNFGLTDDTWVVTSDLASGVSTNELIVNRCEDGPFFVEAISTSSAANYFRAGRLGGGDQDVVDAFADQGAVNPIDASLRSMGFGFGQPGGGPALRAAYDKIKFMTKVDVDGNIVDDMSCCEWMANGAAPESRPTQCGALPDPCCETPEVEKCTYDVGHDQEGEDCTKGDLGCTCVCENPVYVCSNVCIDGMDGASAGGGQLPAGGLQLGDLDGNWLLTTVPASYTQPDEPNEGWQNVGAAGDERFNGKQVWSHTNPAPLAGSTPITYYMWMTAAAGNNQMCVISSVDDFGGSTASSTYSPYIASLVEDTGTLDANGDPVFEYQSNPECPYNSANPALGSPWFGPEEATGTNATSVEWCNAFVNCPGCEEISQPPSGGCCDESTVRRYVLAGGGGLTTTPMPIPTPIVYMGHICDGVGGQFVQENGVDKQFYFCDFSNLVNGIENSTNWSGWSIGESCGGEAAAGCIFIPNFAKYTYGTGMGSAGSGPTGSETNADPWDVNDADINWFDEWEALGGATTGLRLTSPCATGQSGGTCGCDFCGT